ncbi:hypothetical protein KSP40_PGU009928 [Platanthera guangdongensis]|uniref:Protein preY, mitochondrial n=1 Tax=Platanthera guangdongensis TaxID=2320717 RepID=A0ABR2MIN0_9ASPA
MVRGSKAVHLRDAAAISKALFDVLVCPLSRQPLRYCQETQSMISDAIGVSFPNVVKKKGVKMKPLTLPLGCLYVLEQQRIFCDISKAYGGWMDHLALHILVR